MRKACLALAAALCAGPAGAVGFNDVRPGARAMGMGGAFGAIADDAHGFFYNPAGTANAPYVQSGGSLGRMQSPVGTLSFASASYIRPYEKRNTGTIGAGYFLSRQVHGGDKDALIANYAEEITVRRLPFSKPLKVGANFKFVNVDRGSKGGKFGMGFDVGALARTNMGLSMGAALTDLTTDIGVPRGGILLATAYSWRKRFIFAGDLRLAGGHAEFYPGLEAIFHQGLLRARVGKGLPLDAVGTVAFGLGVNFSPVTLDVGASLPFNGINRTAGAYQATFQYRFGAPSFTGQFVGSAAAQAEELRRDILVLEEKSKTLNAQAKTAESNKSAATNELRVLEIRVRESQDQYRALLKRNDELEYRAQEKAAGLEGPRKPAPQRKAAPRAAPVAWPKRHQVLPGDTLRTISRQYYGDPNQWERIYDANRDKVERGLPVEREMLVIPAPPKP